MERKLRGIRNGGVRDPVLREPRHSTSNLSVASPRLSPSTWMLQSLTINADSLPLSAARPSFSPRNKVCNKWRRRSDGVDGDLTPFSCTPAKMWRVCVVQHVRRCMSYVRCCMSVCGVACLCALLHVCVCVVCGAMRGADRRKVLASSCGTLWRGVGRQGLVPEGRSHPSKLPQHTLAVSHVARNQTQKG
eukprot:3106836-Rhodomonas_salina.3